MTATPTQLPFAPGTGWGGINAGNNGVYAGYNALANDISTGQAAIWPSTTSSPILLGAIDGDERAINQSDGSRHVGWLIHRVNGIAFLSAAIWTGTNTAGVRLDNTTRTSYADAISGDYVFGRLNVNDIHATRWNVSNLSNITATSLHPTNLPAPANDPNGTFPNLPDFRRYTSAIFAADDTHAAGYVSAFYFTSTSVLRDRPAIWPVAGGNNDYTLLPLPAGTASGRASAINGPLVGGTAGANAGGNQAVIWRQQGDGTYLSEVLHPAGWGSSKVDDVLYQGGHEAIVGWGSPTGNIGNEAPLLWVNGEAIDLVGLLGGSYLSGQLSGIDHALSDLNQGRLVVYGYLSTTAGIGGTRPVVVELTGIPEPTGALALVGALGLLTRRTRAVRPMPSV